MKNYFIILTIFSSLIIVSCDSEKKIQIDYSKIKGTSLIECNKMLTGVVVADVFNPPLASRVYAYPNIAAYEALIPAFEGSLSYSGRLNKMTGMPQSDKNKRYNFVISSVFAFTTVAKKLVYSEYKVSEYEKLVTDSLAKIMDNDLMQNSIGFGRQIGDSILRWAGQDNFKETRSFSRYVLSNNPGSWKLTPPDYSAAVEPFWGDLRPFAIDSAEQFEIPPPLTFSTETASAFYKEAMETYNISKNLDSNKINTAIFWDCNPNVSRHYGHLTQFAQKMTPGGHWITIAANFMKERDAGILETTSTLSKMAITGADAFIACWHEKYKYSTIRPVTYINAYIDAQWEPLLQTPPFPEYPSGHSTVSGASTTLLKSIYGDSNQWTDSSEVEYGIPVIKTFDSFTSASIEVSESRIMGGIHFRNAVDAGRKQGDEIGEYIFKKLQSR